VVGYFRPMNFEFSRKKNGIKNEELTMVFQQVKKLAFSLERKNMEN
jgi:hypothetical protein